MPKIQIICSSPGIRRNGIEHPASAIYDADRWNDKQLQAFRDDPAFLVQEVAEGGIKISGKDDNETIAAQVNDRVEKIAEGLKASFQDTVAEKVAQALEEAKAAYEQKITDLMAELSTARTEVSELEAENADLKKSLTASQAQVTELETAAKSAPKK